MIRETYKGRQLKAVKGKTYGKSRITVNGTECGEWFDTQADVIEWAKRTIDDVDSRPFEGRWAECWYAPGTYELNEIGHVTAPGGTCSCNLCKTEPWNSCQNITAGGVCVCHYCMKPYLAKEPVVTGAIEQNGPELAATVEEAQAVEIEIGVRVSGEIAGQSFTGIVRSTGHTGGRGAIAADGTFTRIELGTLDSVSVETDNDLVMPSGRKVRRAHVTGTEALGSLRVA